MVIKFVRLSKSQKAFSITERSVIEILLYFGFKTGRNERLTYTPATGVHVQPYINSDTNDIRIIGMNDPSSLKKDQLNAKRKLEKARPI